MFSIGGKKTCSPYIPTTPPQTNVIIKTVGQTNYAALIASKEDEESQFKQLYEAGAIYSAGPLATPTPDPFFLGKDPIKTFYIGSITVVGLFILYRILSKTK
jgi:hypothetical protein